MNAKVIALVAVTFVVALRIDLAQAQPPPPPQPLPPVPVPAQNPITEAKRVLGKILFWDEQLSSDNTMACGTCHISGSGGSDPRTGFNPGPDGLFQTPDDIVGSPGVARMDDSGAPIEDATFGFDVQVTGRTAQPMMMAAHAPNNFWDGRATSTFVDPETGAVLIPAGGGLESQAVGPILSDVEMAHDGRTWDDVRDKLAGSAPLALATNLPPDVEAAIAADPTYGALFTAAFGTPEINASRIAFAIATYERTLVPDQTPFDRFVAGNPNALTPAQQNGLGAFLGQCAVCHAPPVFSDHTFRNIGVRPNNEDIGREGVTGLIQDRGRFKVPSVRNAGLKSTFMHNGVRTTLDQVLDFYLNVGGQQFRSPNFDPAVANINLTPQARIDVIDFVQNGLTDPRVVTETFPFDRPTLASETNTVSVDPPNPGTPLLVGVKPAYPNPFTPRTTLSFTLAQAADVQVSIFNVQGRLVRRLASSTFGAGEHALVWDGQSAHGRVESGVYLYRIAVGPDVYTGRVTLIR